MVEKRGREGDHGDRDSGEMGRGSDERMNVERTTDRAMIDGVSRIFFFYGNCYGNCSWISRIVYCLW